MIMNDELFFAWLDGELDAAAAAQVAAQVAADPGLRRKAAAHRSLAARLSGAFSPIAAAPVPAAFRGSLAPDNVVDLGAARTRRSSRLGLQSAAQWAAMAATLVLGLAAGSILDRGASTPVRNESGTLLASTELDQALDARLASAPAATGPRIGLTFRDQAGSICRSFTDGAAQGLACRAGDEWRIRGLFQTANSPSGEFRMAAGADPALAALIDSTISGDTFDAAAERQAQVHGWH